MFFKISDTFKDNIAIHDADTSVSTTYAELKQLVDQRVREFGSERKLIFIAAENNIHTVVNYIAALEGGNVVYLLDNVQDAKSKTLIDIYKPNIIIDHDGTINVNNDTLLNLHSDLALLLSTSGSTGTPKFVKLSAENIQSNASSISDYLGLTQDDRGMCHLKLHYSYGISILNSHLHAGAAVILTKSNIISEEFWAQVNHYKATSFVGVPHNYESLLHNNFNIKEYPSIKYATQAGGKLAKDLVLRMAADFKSTGAKFIVMYGQTEAAPRISYLPAEMTQDYPDTIGKAVPGGKLFLVDASEGTITAPHIEGELCYQGPNVMMGYAECPDDLSSDETPDFLKTGDIACFNEAGLYYITGRTKRFVKPFGLRINLDDVQSKVKESYSVSAVTGTDSQIIVIVSSTEDRNFDDLRLLLSRAYKLPESIFEIGYYENIPLMVTGKYDYKTILETGAHPKLKQGPIKRIINKILEILEIDNRQWNSILELYCDALERNDIKPEDCFDDLDADSLSFVHLSLALEEVLQDNMPQNWRETPIKDLDVILYQNSI